jgi:hypothetical protein
VSDGHAENGGSATDEIAREEASAFVVALKVVLTGGPEPGRSRADDGPVWSRHGL